MDYELEAGGIRALWRGVARMHANAKAPLEVQRWRAEMQSLEERYASVVAAARQAGNRQLPPIDSGA